MGEQKIEMNLYTGGTWENQEYQGNNIRKHVLKVPLANLTFSVLMDRVKEVARASYADDQILTYKSYLRTRTPHLEFLAITISHQMHMAPFLAHVRERLDSSLPVDLYLD